MKPAAAARLVKSTRWGVADSHRDYAERHPPPRTSPRRSNSAHLTAANAEAGNFPDAVNWEKNALEVWHDDKEEFEKGGQPVRLSEAGKPSRCERNERENPWTSGL